MKRARIVQGRVVDLQGRPLAGATTTIGKGGNTLTNRAKEDGTFVLERLAKEDLELTVRHPKYPPVTLPVPAAMESIVVRMSAGAAVEGRVTGVDGSPIANLYVHVGQQSAQTAADGTFRVEGVGEGPQKLFGGLEPEQGYLPPVAFTASLEKVARVELRAVPTGGAIVVHVPGVSMAVAQLFVDGAFVRHGKPERSATAIDFTFDKLPLAPGRLQIATNLGVKFVEVLPVAGQVTRYEVKF